MNGQKSVGKKEKNMGKKKSKGEGRFSREKKGPDHVTHLLNLSLKVRDRSLITTWGGGSAN